MTGGGLRIVGGQWRGRKLNAPQGLETRPTAVRARQAAFDILLHASWAGAEFIQTAIALDAFAGSGAFGLEFISRGGASASFLEINSAALQAIKSNIFACGATTQARAIRADALHPPAGTPHDLVFLDPPYGQNLIPKALTALGSAGWLKQDALIIAELGPEDDFTPREVLAERRHGKARLIFGR